MVGSDLPAEPIHMVHQIVPVIQIGQGVQEDFFALQIDIEQDKTQGHRSPNQGDSVVEQLNHAAHIDWHEEGHGRHKEILIHLAAAAEGQNRAVGHIAVYDQAGQKKQWGAIVVVV